MLRNYFKITLRKIFKNPVFSFINIAGLSLGTMCFLLILQYVAFERSVNTFHKNAASIHRVLFQGTDGHVYDYSAPIIGPIVKQNFGEVPDFCRVVDQSFVNGIALLSKGDGNDTFSETKTAYVDGNFFELFSFPIEQGNAAQLNQPNTIALSKTTAEKYFANTTAIGQSINFNNEFGSNLYTVVAVFADFPSNSGMQYDLIMSLQTLGNPAIQQNNSWASLEGTSSFLTTYLNLTETSDRFQLEGKLNELKKKLDPSSEEKIMLQPLKHMHLAESLSDNKIHTGNLGFVYLLSGLAILILVIAWFNYVNLSTAAALTRAKEVGLRKVVGASKLQLVTQFLGESLLLNLFSFAVALGLVNLGQFFFNQLINKELSLFVLTTNTMWIWGIVFLLTGALASGAYTAFALSSFRPAQVLKGVFSKSSSGLVLRKALVVFQFSISVLLIAVTLIMNKQLSFMRHEKLGMNINQLMVITHRRIGVDSTYATRRESFKNVLAQADFIQAYCGSANVPTNGFNYSTNGITQLNPAPGDEKKGYSILYVDDRFFPTYEIDFVLGRNFTPQDGQRGYGKIERVILNERAATNLGFTNAEAAVGKQIKWNDAEIEVLAVVKDYHHQSLKQTIEPIVFVPQNSGSFFTIKLNAQNMPEHIAYLKKAFQEYFPGNPFDYFFVDDNYNKQYQTEEQNRKIFITASGFAIFISCLGLFGLSTFTVQQRSKEIGIRKVMGASVTQITSLLSKEFLVLVLIALAVAVPLAWWAMTQWLEQFAYKTELTITVFTLAGVVAIAIALVTIGAQTVRAATANPADSLRSE